MSLSHGMSYLANLDNDLVAVYFHNRHMLLTGSVGGVGYQLHHGFTAAYNRYAGIHILGDDVAALCTLVKLLSHNCNSFFLFDVWV